MKKNKITVSSNSLKLPYYITIEGNLTDKDFLMIYHFHDLLVASYVIEIN